MLLTAILLITSQAFPAFAATQQTKTLEDLYRLALARSEVLATSQSNIENAEALHRRAIYGVLPTVQGLASLQFQDQPPGATGVSSQFTQGFLPNVRLNATQPLFRGLREFLGLKQTSRLMDAERSSYERASQLLFVDVAASALERTRAQGEVRILGDQIDLLQKRQRELQERAAIGRSRKSEVYLAESSIANLEAQRAQVEAALAAQEELLAFLTGESISNVNVVLPFDLDEAPTRLPSLEVFLESLSKRPDLVSFEHRTAAGEAGVWSARGALLPSADLSANYYLARQGILQDVKWDVQLLFTIPIFNPSGAYGDIRQARVQSLQAELAESQAKRDAEREVRTLYASLESLGLQLTALTRSRTFAERNFSELSREYRLGLVTNLETIQALSQFKDAERALERARVSYETDLLRLQVASGKGIPKKEGGA
jgi:outer membrane protein